MLAPLHPLLDDENVVAKFGKLVSVEGSPEECVDKAEQCEACMRSCEEMINNSDCRRESFRTKRSPCEKGTPVLRNRVANAINTSRSLFTGCQYLQRTQVAVDKCVVHLAAN